MRGRQRLVKPEIHSDSDLWEAEQSSGLPLFRAFVGLWNFADREGRFEWKPKQLGVLVLPYWQGDFSAALDVLTSRGFIVRYEVDGRTYGHVRTFHRHQSINNREAPSELPPPPADAARPAIKHLAHSAQEASGTRHVTRLEHAQEASGTRLDGIGSGSGTASGTGTVEVGRVNASAPAPKQEPLSPEAFDPGTVWTAERQATAFRKAWLARYQVDPGMGGKSIAGFHASVLATADARGVDAEGVFAAALAAWLTKPKSEIERRSPYACFAAAWGALLTPTEDVPDPSTATTLAARIEDAQKRLREAVSRNAPNHELRPLSDLVVKLKAESDREQNGGPRGRR